MCVRGYTHTQGYVGYLCVYMHTHTPSGGACVQALLQQELQAGRTSAALHFANLFTRTSTHAHAHIHTHTHMPPPLSHHSFVWTDLHHRLLLRTAGFDQQSQSSIFAAVSVVLHIGNLLLGQDGNGDATLASDRHLQVCVCV